MSLKNFPGFLLNFSQSEMDGKKQHFYCFRSFRLDVGERQLLHQGEAVPLTPKAFDVLVALVERSGHLVEKDELLQLVWADSFVEEANVARIVHTLRKVLGEDENGNKFIETVAKKGYRFVAQVDDVREPTTPEIPAGVEPLPQPPPLETAKSIAPLVSQPKQKSRIVLFTLGFVCAVALLVLVSFNRQAKSSFNPDEVKSIAVLPLKSLAADNREPVYELAIAESLIFKLSGVKNLVIRSLSVTQLYVDAKKNAVAIGKEQQVDFVLASNYQIADGKIRVTSELINVANGVVEEVFRDEQTISSSFAVQDAVTENIGQALLRKLNRKPNNLVAKRYTNNDEAYRLYWLGKVLANKRIPKDAEKAVEYFEQAIKLDPNYALAYAELAGAYGIAGMSGGENDDQYLKGKAAVEKALAIDDSLAEAHSQLGSIKFRSEWDFEGAERAHKRAVELDPNSATVRRGYAIYLNSMGRFDEALAENKTAIDLEPASVLNQRDYGMILYFARHFDEAITQLERTVEMDPNFVRSYGWLISAHRRKGNDDKAFEWFLRSPHRKTENPEKIELWKKVYAESGWRGMFQQQVENALEEEKNGKTPTWELANLYGELGDKENAFAYIEKGIAGRRGWGWTIIKVNPSYDSLRSDPRFERLVKLVGVK